MHKHICICVCIYIYIYTNRYYIHKVLCTFVCIYIYTYNFILLIYLYIWSLVFILNILTSMLTKWEQRKRHERVYEHVNECLASPCHHHTTTLNSHAAKHSLM